MTYPSQENRTKPTHVDADIYRQFTEWVQQHNFTIKEVLEGFMISCVEGDVDIHIVVYKKVNLKISDNNS